LLPSSYGRESSLDAQPKKKYTSEKDLLFFLGKLLLIWLSWKLVFFVLGEEKMPLQDRVFPVLSSLWESFNALNVHVLLVTCQGVLQLLGYQAEITGRSIWIEQIHAVGVGNYCLGIQLIYYFSLLVLISKASKIQKAKAILFGVLITQVLNIIRISGLAILVLLKPEWVHFFHDHIFNVMVFGVMILYYLRYISRADDMPKQAKDS
jgi:exosortase/archaeosortase family protein